jgi:hypothetical protein
MAYNKQACNKWAVSMDIIEDGLGTLLAYQNLQSSDHSSVLFAIKMRYSGTHHRERELSYERHLSLRSREEDCFRACDTSVNSILRFSKTS